MKQLCRFCVVVPLVFIGAHTSGADEQQPPASGTSAPPVGPGMGRGMMRQGGGPCMDRGPGLPMQQGQPGHAAPMGPGYGRGMMHGMTPEQRQQHWEQMRQRGYNPGMGRGMTPEQRRQHWEQMRQQGYGPGMMGRMPPAPPAEMTEPAQ